MGMTRILTFIRFMAAAGAIALVCSAFIALAHAQTTQTSWTPPAAAASQGGLDNYQLGPGDKLRVIVYGEDDLGGTFDVDGGGFVSLPLIGQVKVAGFTARQVEGAVTNKLSDGFVNQPRVNVEVQQYRPFYVIGEVNKPGEYPYVNEMNVLNAVAVAGGYTQKAVESGFYVRRNGDPHEVYISADAGAKIYPGDVVRIDSSAFWDAISILGPLTGFAAVGSAFHN